MKDGLESLGRVRLQGLVLLLVMFVVGVLGGMALERVRMTRRAPRERAPIAGMRGGMPPMFAQLNLTREQHQRIETILQQSRPLTDSVLRSSLPRLRAIRDSVRLQIRAVLTPEQQERFDAMEPRWGDRGPGAWDMMRPRERGRRGGPPEGPRPEPPPPDSF